MCMSFGSLMILPTAMDIYFKHSFYSLFSIYTDRSCCSWVQVHTLDGGYERPGGSNNQNSSFHCNLEVSDKNSNVPQVCNILVWLLGTGVLDFTSV
jgi:hypothetical protein